METACGSEEYEYEVALDAASRLKPREGNDDDITKLAKL